VLSAVGRRRLKKLACSRTAPHQQVVRVRIVLNAAHGYSSAKIARRRGVVVGTFGHEPGVLDGMEIPAMSVAGLLAMKEQYPALRNGGPWRAKDKTDVEVQVLASESGAGG
jgi:hypothetical protein